jgi:hypothetical protein
LRDELFSQIPDIDSGGKNNWKKKWSLKYLSSEDPKNQFIRLPYNIPGNKGFDIEVGFLPDGEYAIETGDSTISAMINGKQWFGKKARVFFVENGVVNYPTDPSGVDKYMDSKRNSLPNFGNPKRGCVTPELDIPTECLTREWLGNQSTFAVETKKATSVSTGDLKLSDFVIEQMDGDRVFEIMELCDGGDTFFGAQIFCDGCGDTSIVKIRKK